MTQKGRARFAPSEGYRALAREVSPILESSDRDLVAADATPWLVERLQAFFTSRTERAPQPLYLHKFTGWPRAGFLHVAFPEARYANVIRDGRAVANSWLQMPWWRGYQGPEHWHFGPLSPEHAEAYERSRRSYVVLAGLAWVLLMDAFEAAKADLPERSGSTCATKTSWPTRPARSGASSTSTTSTSMRRSGFGWIATRSPPRAPTPTSATSTPRPLKALEEVQGPTLERYGYV